MIIQTLWKQKTHVHPEYFLALVLEFLGVPNSFRFGELPNTLILFIDEKGEPTGKLEISQRSIRITKPEAKL